LSNNPVQQVPVDLINEECPRKGGDLLLGLWAKRHARRKKKGVCSVLFNGGKPRGLKSFPMKKKRALSQESLLNIPQRHKSETKGGPITKPRRRDLREENGTIFFSRKIAKNTLNLTHSGGKKIPYKTEMEGSKKAEKKRPLPPGDIFLGVGRRHLHTLKKKRRIEGGIDMQEAIKPLLKFPKMAV